jgi:type IV pilus assembly protein PilV
MTSGDRKICFIGIVERGFTMIEVLVSLFVFAVGMLSMAALQVTSVRANFDAVQRSAATMLAYDIIERMRANSSQLIEYAGDDTTPAAALGGATQGGTTTPPNPNCATASCTAYELSQYDRWDWENALDGASEKSGAGAGATDVGGLVQPTACITTTVPAGLSDRSGEYWVAIAWRGKTEIDTSTSDSNCGAGISKYDGDSGADTYRRVIVVKTYISAK